MNGPTSLRIAYIAVRYPSITFIQSEIAGLNRQGVDVLPIALNPASDEEILSAQDAGERERTMYVKATRKLKILRVVSSAAIRHPVAFARGAVRALTAGGSNLGLGLKTLLQFIEALLVWDYCRHRSVHSIHAHFGQAPASVAWQATEFGNATGKNRWTWGMTIHGPHDFFNEDTALLKKKIHHADQVICISHFARAQLLRIATPADWHKIHIVYCGIDLDQFPLRSPKVQSVPPVLVTTARLAPEKGQLLLLAAVEQLRDEGLEVEVRFIGSGPLREQLQERADAAGLSANVVLTGSLTPDQVAAELRDADLFCLPSSAEGLPISIMEAMAVGVPVLGTYVGGIPELLVDDQTGWVVPVGSVSALAAGIRAALTSPRRDDVISNAHHAVTAQHDGRVSAIELAGLLEACHNQPD